MSITTEQLVSILDDKLAPINAKMSEIQQSIDMINEKYEEMKTKLASQEQEQKDIRNENHALKTQLRDTVKELNDLKIVCNDLEQYSRRDCVEIREVPRPRMGAGREDTDDIVMKVAEAIGVEVDEEDISISHRRKTSDSYRGKKVLAPPIIVKFTRRKIKGEF